MSTFQDWAIFFFVCLLGLAARNAVFQTNSFIRVFFAIVALIETLAITLFKSTDNYWLFFIPVLNISLISVTARKTLRLCLLKLESVFNLTEYLLSPFLIATFAYFAAMVRTGFDQTLQLVTSFGKMEITKTKISFDDFRTKFQAALESRHRFIENEFFKPDSFPQLIAVAVFAGALLSLFLNMKPLIFAQPNMLFPGLPIEKVFNYNGLVLLIISLFGVGFKFGRNLIDCFKRLGLSKPTKAHLCIAILIILTGFAYDAYWAINISHHLEGQDLATQLAHYSTASFDSKNSLALSALLTLILALFFALGEEVLLRGALQPVFGILPVALLESLLYGQFALAPIFMIKIFFWSVFLGLIRRYTNTTTTLMGHAGLNFITVWLYYLSP